jgi:DNA repair protein RadC
MDFGQGWISQVCSYRNTRRGAEPIPERSVPVNGDVGTPRAAARLAAAVLAGLTVEQVIALHVVSIGTLNASLVHPREVFKAALLTNAAGLILAHNHPSGDPTPSPDDRALVSRLRQAGDILGVELLDALIVTDPMDGGAYYSFREARRCCDGPP